MLRPRATGTQIERRDDEDGGTAEDVGGEGGGGEGLRGTCYESPQQI